MPVRDAIFINCCSCLLFTGLEIASVVEQVECFALVTQASVKYYRMLLCICPLIALPLSYHAEVRGAGLLCCHQGITHQLLWQEWLTCFRAEVDEYLEFFNTLVA